MVAALPVVVVAAARVDQPLAAKVFGGQVAVAASLTVMNGDSANETIGASPHAE
jgi:hypothetical protein